jgi:response regulator NasT
MVDDDRLILTIIAKGLTSAGYQVSKAESADEAENLLMSGEKPDLILLDVNMPGRSGLELAVLLNKLYFIPFILLTAYNDNAIVEQAAANGAMSYLVKPVEVSQLIPTIETAWLRAQDIKELRENGNQLQTALSAERDISIAVGITMAQYRVDRRAAFEKLRKTARSQRRRLSDLANEIINACEVLNLAANLKKNDSF